METSKYVCYECGELFQDPNGAIKHLRTHGVEGLELLRCMRVQSSSVLYCDSKFQSLKTLKKHLNAKNCIILSTDTQTGNSSESALEDEFGGLCLSESNSNGKRTSILTSCSGGLIELIRTTVDKLSTFKLQHNVFDEVIELTKELVLKSTETNQQLMRENPSENVNFILESTKDFVVAHFDKFSSRYKRKVHIGRSPYYVAPEEIKLSENETGKNTHLYYVSILKTIVSLFAHEHFRNAYFDYNENHQCTDGEYERFCCGTNFKRNELFQSNKNAIQIQIFYDDFELTDALKTKDIKVCGIYFIIHNFPPTLTSQLQNMYLICVCEKSVIKKYGLQAILRPLVQDLKSLEDEGISINNKFNLKGTLVQASFDNLGGNELFGFVKSFSAKHFCRICNCDKETCQKITCERANTLRTKQEYETKMIEVDGYLRSGRSIDFKKTLGYANHCLLNDLKYFHSIENRSQDVMHDVYEGGMRFVMKHMLGYLVSHNIISREEIIEKVHQYDFGALEQQNVPSKIMFGKDNLNQNASQMHCLVKHVPFIFVDQYNIKDATKKKKNS